MGKKTMVCANRIWERVYIFKIRPRRRHCPPRRRGLPPPITATFLTNPNRMLADKEIKFNQLGSNLGFGLALYLSQTRKVQSCSCWFTKNSVGTSCSSLIFSDLLQCPRQIQKQIAETTDRTTKLIAETTDRISKQIAETTDRTTKQIEETTDRISKQIAETTDRTTKQIEETTDRISKQIVEFTDRITKLDWEVNALRAQLPVEIHGLRAQLEAAKYDVIEYCIRTVVSISAVTLAVLRIGL